MRARSKLYKRRYWTRSRRRAVYLGIIERAKLGRQHFSSTVRCTRSAQPLLWGRPAWMKRSWAPVLAKAWRNSWERNSLPLSVETAFSRQPAWESSLATWCTSAEV